MNNFLPRISAILLLGAARSAIATLLFVSFTSFPVNTSIALPTTQNQTEKLTRKDYLQLVGIKASDITVRAKNPSYYFTIKIPHSSPELQKINIHQRGGMDTVEFQAHRVRAYVRGKTKQKVKITNIDSKPKNITITFDPVISPGQELILAMGVKENPSSGGNYLFEVQAFFPEYLGLVQFIGVGRLRIESI